MTTGVPHQLVEVAHAVSFEEQFFPGGGSALQLYLIAQDGDPGRELLGQLPDGAAQGLGGRRAQEDFRRLVPPRDPVGAVETHHGGWHGVDDIREVVLEVQDGLFGAPPFADVVEDPDPAVDLSPLTLHRRPSSVRGPCRS